MPRQQQLLTPAELTQLAAALNEKIQRQLVAQVASQRMAGASWSAVGRVLGVSKQAAHERWRWVDDEPVSIGRDEDGAGVARSLTTGGAVGREQVQQVARHGEITAHHHEVVALGALVDTATARAHGRELLAALDDAL
jgi:hypothetical protein